jgi:transglutaminase-like putative cysteine protease
MNAYRRVITWANADEKAAWIDGMAFTDARLPLVRDLAVRMARARDINDRLGLMRDLQTFVRDAIGYIEDPSWEEISDSQTILERGYGDCDDKVRLFVALARAVGRDSRVRPVHDQEGFFYHVQAEARWPGSEQIAGSQPGGWVLIELILRGCGIGQTPASMPQSTTGARVLQ